MPDAKSAHHEIIRGLTILGLIAIGILSMSAPILPLLGGGYAIRGLVHGLSAGLLMVCITVGCYQAYRLWIGDELKFEHLKAGVTAYCVATVMTIISGNWIYIPYRAVADSPRTYFLANSPEIHKVWFEFKEFVALFPLPLSVATAYIVFAYGPALMTNHNLRRLVSLLLVLGFFYFAIAFGLGAAVTKLRSV